MKPGPTFKDWLLVLVCATFSAGAVFLLVVGRGGRGPIGILTLFGGGTAVAVWMVTEKLRMRTSAEAVHVEVVGGVPIPAKQGIRWGMGAGLLVAGSIMTWSGADIGLGFEACSVVIAATGAGLLALLATGLAGGQTLTFEPEGLRYGDRRASYLIRWTNVASVQAAEYHANPAALILVHDVEELVASATGPHLERARAHARRLVQKNQTWAGCHVFLLPYHFGFDSVLFVKAVSGYASDPARRQELGARRKLPAEASS